MLSADATAVRQLKLVRDIGPKGAFIAAGFIRNRVWDAIYARSLPPLHADVDIVYFCKTDVSPERDYAFEKHLNDADGSTDWQVRNQARMHVFHGYPPFTSLEQGLMHWAETATSVGVQLDEQGEMHFVAPFGFNDLAHHILCITPAMKEMDPAGFNARLEAKGWLKRWPRLRVVR